MSEHPISAPVEERFNLSKLGFLPLALLVTGLFFTGLSLAWGYCGDRTQFAFSWLFAFMVCFTLCAGCLFWVLLHHALDADWSVVVRRVPETIASLFFPWMLLAFIPIALLRKELFVWWTVLPGADHLLDHKSGFLNHGFFWVRAALYFGGFGLLGWLLRKNSVAQDGDGNVHLSILQRRTAYVGIPFFAVSITFAAIDWMMSLNYHWFSTMFGVYVFAGVAGSSMALMILVSNLLKAGGYLKNVMTVEHNHIMGKLLFAFVIFWAYVSFSQYMLYYYANIPEETIWFVHRNTGSWHEVSIFLVFAHFFIPFIMLLTQPAKRNPYRITFAAIWYLGVHVLDLYWIIMPQLQLRHAGAGAVPTGFHPQILDFTCLIGLLALLTYAFLRKLPQAALFPIRDPRLYESVTLVN